MLTGNKKICLYSLFIPFLIIAFITGCTPVNPNSKKTLTQDTPRPKLEPVITPEQVVTGDELEELRYSLDLAEYYYALGVNANREGEWETAQKNFEKSLEILSEIDVTADSNGVNTRFNTLLNEIEQDYRFTLTSLGILSNESSHNAFIELFSDIKNFKSLRESLTAARLEEPDSVVYDMPIEFNERVENSLVYLQTVGRKHFGLYLSRMGHYKDLMLEIIRQYELPEDLVYLPLIESGFNPRAYSYARASGPWQFISSTGKLYGLNRNWWYDERRDFVKSTHAACKYLKFLYGKFGDWKLALAAYNGGEGRVSRTIKRMGTNDFWKLRLKRQTMNYVPLYMAATIIAKDPDKYGYGDVEYMEPISFETVTVDKVISLSKLAEKMDVSYQQLKDLNPELMRGVTPPNFSNYQLRVPAGYKETFAQIYASLPGEKTTNWITHRVRRGETLSTIAQRYGVRMSAIASSNKLSSRSRIYAGQKLLIPVPAGYKKPASTASSSRYRKPIKTKDGNYTVRRGDSLWEIARRFGTTVTKLKQMNNLSGRNPKVYPGDVLKVTDSGNESSGEAVVHIVKKGDTLWSIARRYSTTVSDIRRLNNLSMNRQIMPGDRLRISPSG
ncbi:MAG: LysM peptidoglycan-binding domain-containing protein [candidate division Zixibacteria bacterium]|nr:LysM peptidoglycan-binding domain-containing protein [candidate division Zixibacteria bacterium]